MSGELTPGLAREMVRQRIREDPSVSAVSREPLEALHGGWPFGPGPDEWAWHINRQRATAIQPAGLHVCCTECGQSITRIGRWSVMWRTLKPQIAAHVMQVHSEHVTG